MRRRCRHWIAFSGLAALSGLAPRAVAQAVTLGGTTFTHRGLVGVGRIDADKKDKLGETFGSLSGLALDLRTWRRSAGGTYSGTLYTQPDRGYTKSGATTNYRSRRHRFTLSFKPDTNGSSNQDQVDLSLAETTLLVEASGTPLTSLDPTVSGSRAGTPPLPQAFNGRIAIDPEGLALLPDGTFFVSDEYGPYLYRFAASGTLLGAVRPPEAFIPKRAAQDSFSSDSPAAGQPSPSPSQPQSGRENSRGLEGLSVSADGRTLYTLMQSATRQDGGSSGGALQRHARLLAYDVSTPSSPLLTGEWILPLPTYTESGTLQTATVGDIATLSNRFLLVLVRDGNGRGGDTTRSLYRAVLVYDLQGATNLAGSAFDSPNSPAAPNGVLAAGITPATSAILIDLNSSAELDKFDLNNSANANSDTLAEKWESLQLVSALDAAAPDDFFLLVGNDNDFSTTDGTQDGASYKAGLNVDTMILAYRVTLPGTALAPALVTEPASRAVTAGQSATFSVVALATPPPAYQWSRNGTALAGATTASLTLAGIQGTDAGTYTVKITNVHGSITSAAATLTVNGANAPVFTAQPAAQTIAPGTTVVFSAAATNSPAYQWQRDGVNLPGATRPLLVISSAGAAQAGDYSVVATNASGVALSAAATLAVRTVSASDTGRLLNLSILTEVTATDALTLGVVIGGSGTSGTKPLLVRAAGPSLATFGITDGLADPKLDVLAGSSVFATNDNWGGTPSLAAVFAQSGAFAYLNAASRDAAVYQPATPARDYTIQVSGVGGTTGPVLAELYDATPGGSQTATSPRLVNLSVLKVIPTGSSLTAGFVIGGTTARTVLIRAIGPRLALTPFNVAGTMSDPRIDLLSGSSIMASNDNWGGDAQLASASAAVSAFALTDAASRDAMLLVTLAPGNYTVRVAGANDTGGRVLVECYEVP